MDAQRVSGFWPIGLIGNTHRSVFAALRDLIPARKKNPRLGCPNTRETVVSCGFFFFSRHFSLFCLFFFFQGILHILNGLEAEREREKCSHIRFSLCLPASVRPHILLTQGALCVNCKHEEAPLEKQAEPRIPPDEKLFPALEELDWHLDPVKAAAAVPNVKAGEGLGAASGGSKVEP